VGYGFIFNRNWGKKIVVDLDGRENNTIKQKLGLTAGYYNLQLKYAATTRFANSSEMDIYFNNQFVIRVKAKDYKVNDLSLSLLAVDGCNELEIHRKGKSDGKGLSADFGQLIKTEILI
jgi:hypothetical protein